MLTAHGFESELFVLHVVSKIPSVVLLSLMWQDRVECSEKGKNIEKMS